MEACDTMVEGANGQAGRQLSNLVGENGQLAALIGTIEASSSICEDDTLSVSIYTIVHLVKRVLCLEQTYL